MQQIARNVTMTGWGIPGDCRYLLHDGDTKYSVAFRTIIESGDLETLPLPARSPNLNPSADRWVRSVKAECPSKIIPFGERSLQRAKMLLAEYDDVIKALARRTDPTRRLAGLASLAGSPVIRASMIARRSYPSRP
jgi:hypothetical protein